MEFIENVEQLRSLYGAPWPDAVRKQLPSLDRHARNFLARSPFVVISSQDAAGRADVSPRGDRPGFATVLGSETIAIPDRPGNNRLDTWQNILENPCVGLLFLIPGMNETLRVNGTARLTADKALCSQLNVNGRPARAVLVVTVTEVFLHCAKAFVRSSLWAPESWPDRAEFPTLGEIMRDQLDLCDNAEDIDRMLSENYRVDLW